MLISEEEARRRLEHENNFLRVPKVEKPVEEKVIEPEIVGEVRDGRRGKHGTGEPVDPSFRALVGIAAQHDTVANVAATFGSNAVTVKHARDGENSNGKKVLEGEIVIDHKKQIQDKLLDLLLNGLDTITVEDMHTVKLKDRSSILKDLAAVQTSMAPKASVEISSKIVIMSPGVGKESDFMTLEVEASA